jgi:ATP-dependent Clp protease ATP-binding subunit ClpC
MTTLSEERRLYAPHTAFDRYLPKRWRVRVLQISHVTYGLLTLFLLGVFVVSGLASGQWSLAVVRAEAPYFLALWLITFPLYTGLLALSAFYNTFYYRGITSIVPEGHETGGILSEVAALVAVYPDDLTRSFAANRYGREIIARAGVPLTELDSYLRGVRTTLHSDALPVPSDHFMDLADVATYLATHDPDFTQFLFRQGVTTDDFLGAARWVSRVRRVYKARRRWWSRDNLGRIRGLGREFSYGIATQLRRYIRNPDTSSLLSHVLFNAAYAREIAEKVESILARDQAANALVIGNPGLGTLDILTLVGERLRTGQSVASLSGKRLVILNTTAFLAGHESKSAFEPAFLALLGEAQGAGEMVIVIPDLPGFIQSARTIGVDVADLLTPFLHSHRVHIVATADPAAFHTHLESEPELMSAFASVLVEDLDLTSTIRVLETATWELEHRHHVLFTHRSIVRTAEAADRYVVSGVMPEKALALLDRVTAAARTERLTTILPTLVDAVVSAETGIPIGPVSDEERERLLHLEDALHARVVGQDDAISAIARTLRRVRTGVQSTNRPLGSFLFLGSTGVGKTETAKALAATFFGSVDKMLRFDMSEFSTPEGLVRLLGHGLDPGLLATALREHPYGVLLLDEFDKAARPVHDLFLQILDEGVFTDGRGERVNARNTIIIATANAGSEHIYELVKAGVKPSEAHDEIMAAIITTGIFRPELINRFDAAIIFETLTPDYEAQIATLMLDEVVERVRQQGYALELDPDVAPLLAEVGFDPTFGARPLRRVVQDVIEATVADKILRESLKPGATIHIAARDLSLT